MLNALKLKGVGPAPEINLALAPRLNLLTGDNGLGKTFVLDVAWWALTGTWTSEPAWPDGADDPLIAWQLKDDLQAEAASSQATYDFSAQAWERLPMLYRRDGSPAAPPTMAIFARIDGGVSVWDPARNLSRSMPRRRDGAVAGGEVPAAYHFSASEVWDGLDIDGRVLCRGLIEDWVSWQQSKDPAFVLLRDVLRLLSPDEQEQLIPGEPRRVWIDDVREIPTLAMPYGTIPLTLAAAGIRRIVALAYLLVWTWREHQQAMTLRRQSPHPRIVLLLDELEAHLHPRWQRMILPALLKATQRLLPEPAEVQILATTHAPLVLASLEPEHDPARDAVFHFELGADGQVDVEAMAWRSRGDACAWLTSEIFALDEARSVEAEQILEAARKAMREPAVSREKMREIHDRLRTVLPDTDPFWVRWRFRAERSGLDV